MAASLVPQTYDVETLTASLLASEALTLWRSNIIHLSDDLHIEWSLEEERYRPFFAHAETVELHEVWASYSANFRVDPLGALALCLSGYCREVRINLSEMHDQYVEPERLWSWLKPYLSTANRDVINIAYAPGTVEEDDVFCKHLPPDSLRAYTFGKRVKDKDTRFRLLMEALVAVGGHGRLVTQL